MSLLSDQKLTKKKRRKKTLQTGSGGRAKRLLSNLAELGANATRSTFQIVRAHPRKAGLVALALMCSVGVSKGVDALERRQARTLPQVIHVSAPNAELRARLHAISTEALENARRAKLPRDEFLRRLTNTAAAIDVVDDVSLRAGLDGRLQITASMQSPALVLETAGGEKFLVSRKARIISRVPPDASPGIRLTRVSLPDVRFVPQASTRSATPSGASPVARPTRFVPQPSVNLAWIVHQAQHMQETFGSRLAGFALDKMTWKNATGFSLLLSRPVEVPMPTPTPALPADGHMTQQATVQPPAPARLIVTLGDANIHQKMKKLADVLKDLDSRQLLPESIDLNYRDKAIIKLTETRTQQQAL